MTALRAYLDRIWDEALTAFAKAAQAAPGRSLHRRRPMERPCRPSG
ncbi:MAG TPA: hypothetical protein VN907_04255 [Actinomycetes bacterium]|nr:hypothetical protein [Actinomycetes bacterium]HXP14498.1 hypothetical protein [Actinomycetes bacterium]